MKINFRIFAALLVAGSFSCKAQLSTLDSFTHLGDRFDKQWSAGTFKTEGKTFAGSNSLNVKMFNDILFRTTFSEDAKSKFVNGTQKRNNTLVQSEIKAEFKINGKWGVYTSYGSIDALKMNNDFSKLVFFGNAVYENQNVITENSKYISATTTTIGATRNLVSSDKWQLKAALGVQIASRYREISATKLGVFTAPRGSYLDIEADGLSISESSSGLQGAGLSGNLYGSYAPDANSSLSFSIDNLNILRLNNKTRLDLDSSFRFTGVYLDVLNDSSNFVDRFDSTYNDVVSRSRKEANWLSLPSTISLSYQKRLGKKAIGSVSLSTIGIGAFGVSGNVGLHYTFGPNFVLFSSLGYGNFTGLQWREAAEYRSGRNSFYLSVVGLQSLAVSKLTNSYGASIGYAFIL